MSGFASGKAFTVDEANRLIRDLEPILARLERLAGQAERHRDRLQVLDLLWGDDVHDAESPDHEEFVRHRAAYEATMERIGALVRDEIVARGVRLPPGGLEHGLLDFPTKLDGRWVYLCWRRGEPRVEHWHETSAGFAGRQPVTPDHRRRLGTEG